MRGISKRELKQIARRWAKGLIVNTEVSIAFEDLSIEEVNYIEDELMKIAIRITDLPHANETGTLLDEYK